MLSKSARNDNINFATFMLFSEVQELIDEFDLFLENDLMPTGSVSGDSTEDNAARQAKRNMYIDPVTGKNWRTADRWRRLAAVREREVARGVEPKHLWVTFSEVSKVGQRMFVSSTKTTPTGVFVFPIDFVLREKEATPFSNRPYMHVVRTREDHYEVGAVGGVYGGEDPALTQIKDNLKLVLGTITNPAADAGNKIAEVGKNIQKIVAKWSGWAETNDGTEETKQLINHTKQWVSDYINYAVNDIRYGGSNVEESLKNLKTKLADLDKDNSKEEAEQIRQEMKHYLENMLFWIEPNLEPDEDEDEDEDEKDIDFGDEVNETAKVLKAINQGYIFPGEMKQAGIANPEDSITDALDKGWIIKSSFGSYKLTPQGENILNGGKTEHALHEAGYTKIFSHVDPQTLQCTYSEQYVAYIKKYPSYNETAKNVEANKPYSIEEIAKQQRDEFKFGDISDKWHQYQNLKYINHRTVKIFKKIMMRQMNKAIDEIVAKSKEPEAPLDYNVIPMFDKLKAVADKYGLNLTNAIKKGINSPPKPVKNPQQVVYRVAEALAKELAGNMRMQSGKTTHWQMIWNRVLRELGIKAIADTRHSGHVHNSEPTQGTLMDPRDIEHVATILNVSHASQNDPANRPSVNYDPEAVTATWLGSNKGMHMRVISPTDQRKNPNIDLSHPGTYRGMSTENRMATALKQKVDTLNHRLDGHYGYTPDQARPEGVLVILYKTVKTWQRLITQFPSVPQYGFNTSVREVLHRVAALPHNDAATQSRIQQLTDTINKMLLSGTTEKQPVYSRTQDQKTQAATTRQQNLKNRIDRIKQNKTELEGEYGWSPPVPLSAEESAFLKGISHHGQIIDLVGDPTFGIESEEQAQKILADLTTKGLVKKNMWGTFKLTKKGKKSIEAVASTEPTEPEGSNAAYPVENFTYAT